MKVLFDKHNYRNGAEKVLKVQKVKVKQQQRQHFELVTFEPLTHCAAQLINIGNGRAGTELRLKAKTIPLITWTKAVSCRDTPAHTHAVSVTIQPPPSSAYLPQ